MLPNISPKLKAINMLVDLNPKKSERVFMELLNKI